MQAQFEQFESMFKELGVAAPSASDAPVAPRNDPSQPATDASSAEASFQQTIQRTMERMQASGAQATSAATADAQAPDDFMAEMLRQLQSGGLDGEGGDEEFSKMLLGVMEQLTNKEILYEPMKELSDKFPAWIEKNKDTTSKEDLKRYEEQQRLASEIVSKFEESAYSDSNAADREYIVDRMQSVSDPGPTICELLDTETSAYRTDASCRLTTS